MKLGSGTHVYEIDERWTKLPEHVKFGYTHGVVVDSRDRVYVHNRSKDGVIVFDRDGKFLSSWGEEFAAGAHGMFLSREAGAEYLYFADPVRHIVVKTSMDGRTLWTLGVPDLPQVYSDASKYKPTDVAIAPNGDVYVCDGYGESWIHQYDKDAKWIRSWGGKGSEPGKLNSPHGIWVDTRTTPSVYVADRSNNRIQIFTLDGQHIGFVTAELRLPCCFYEFENELYIPDLHSRVTVLDKNNQVILHLGDEPGAWKKAGWPNVEAQERKVGKFISPHALCVDSHGDIYVVEWISDGRLTKLVRCR